MLKATFLKIIGFKTFCYFYIAKILAWKYAPCKWSSHKLYVFSSVSKTSEIFSLKSIQEIFLVGMFSNGSWSGKFWKPLPWSILSISSAFSWKDFTVCCVQIKNDPLNSLQRRPLTYLEYKFSMLMWVNT